MSKQPERGIRFLPASHQYRLDGKKVPGVTTLIKGGLPNDALKFWAARSVAEWVADHPNITEQLAQHGGRGPLVAALKAVPFQKRDDAAVRGTDVHALAERLVRGEEVVVPDHLRDYVQSCVDFLDDWQPEALVAERPVAHRAHWWAGTPDLFARLPGGRVVLFDYKTSDSGIWPETAFQLAAYSRAEFWQDESGEEHPVPEVDLCAAVWLRPDGYDVVPLKADDQTYREFRHLAFVADVAKRAKGSKTTPGYVLPALPVPDYSAEDAA